MKKNIFFCFFVFSLFFLLVGSAFANHVVIAGPQRAVDATIDCIQYHWGKGAWVVPRYQGDRVIIQIVKDEDNRIIRESEIPADRFHHQPIFSPKQGAMIELALGDPNVPYARYTKDHKWSKKSDGQCVWCDKPAWTDMVELANKYPKTKKKDVICSETECIAWQTVYIEGVPQVDADYAWTCAPDGSNNPVSTYGVYVKLRN